MSREAWGPPHVEPEGLFALEASVQTQVAVTAGMRVCAWECELAPGFETFARNLTSV